MYIAFGSFLRQNVEKFQFGPAYEWIMAIGLTDSSWMHPKYADYLGRRCMLIPHERLVKQLDFNKVHRHPGDFELGLPMTFSAELTLLVRSLHFPTRAVLRSAGFHLLRQE